MFNWKKQAPSIVRNPCLVFVNSMTRVETDEGRGEKREEEDSEEKSYKPFILRRIEVLNWTHEWKETNKKDSESFYPSLLAFFLSHV